MLVVKIWMLVGLFSTHCIKTMQNALFYRADQAIFLSAVICNQYLPQHSEDGNRTSDSFFYPEPNVIKLFTTLIYQCSK
jgi:hypothetical protein